MSPTMAAGGRKLLGWIPRLDPSLLSVDDARDNILHQTSAVTIRRSHLVSNRSAKVALLSFRSCYARKQQLWEATQRLLEHRVFGQPSHPNLVSVIALANKNVREDDAEARLLEPGDSTPSFVVMEMMPTSLYDTLHVDGLKLSRSEILFVAQAVLDTLRFVHHSGDSFGSTLTSRKVMLGGTRHVKLRRFCSEWVRREVETTSPGSEQCQSTSQYMMPSSMPSNAASMPLQHAQRSDLYAFGMLLLEMCTGNKPTPELCNSISLAGRVDPRLELIVRATLAIDSDPAQLARDGVGLDDTASLMTYCTRLLSECADTDSSMTFPPERCSSNSFKSFLHADRYFLTLEEAHVEQQLAERLAQSVVALKRLAAVEEDLVDEQKNFDVVVKQLEQLRLDKASDERTIKEISGQLTQARAELLTKADELLESQADVGKSQAQLNELGLTLRETELKMESAHARRAAIERERQALLVEVLRLKEEKRECVDEKHELERQLVETRAKVGGEKDAIEELEARYTQTIHRCEQEQHCRRRVERQLEALSRQLTAMEEERSRYCGALQMAPTGSLDVRASKHLVLELKEKEIQSLRSENEAIVSALTEARSELTRSEGERSRLEHEVCTEMKREIDRLVEEVNKAIRAASSLTSERDLLQLRATQAKTVIDELQSTIAVLETKIGDLQKHVADAEKARRLRQCLTPNCDAPRYLVKPSGFCVDCEEKMSKDRAKSRASISSSSSMSMSAAPSRERGARGHRRQRSLDGATATLNNTKNTPIMDLLKRIEAARDCDDESREESSLDLVSIMKQLGRLLKESVMLKEDLPECGVLRCVLSVMEQFLSSPPVVIECCKTLSITIFNHDRNRLILVAEGAVELLLRLLKAFPRETKVLETAAVLLTNLSHNCESNRQRILAAGGVDAVLEMMQAFPRDVSIQKKACWALLTLAGSDFMCDKIAALGGVGATLAAMLNCPQDEEVQHYGCWALLNLVSGTRHLQEFARQEGVVEVVEAALACFPDHNGIQEKCRDILDLVQESVEMSS